MVYKLKQNYFLRGWDGLARVLIHSPENSYKVLTPEEFQVLLLCDGLTEFESDCITDRMRVVLRQLENNSIIEVYEGGVEIDEKQHYEYFSNRFVRLAFWSITGFCNFHCRHCYMDAPKGTLNELSLKQSIGLIDQMAECGILRVDITGGEPFVRKDFWQLIDRILYHGIAIGQIYTNGWLITDKILDEFEKRELKPEFSISFDGIGWHDWMRGKKGAEKKFCML